MANTPRAAGEFVRRREPESFRARSLSVSLTAKDLQKSLAWYHDVVGFIVEEKYERDGKLNGASLKAGRVSIVISQDDGAKGWDRSKGEGMSVYFSTAQDIDELARRIKERGGQLETEPTDMPWGARLFSVRDPDGFRLVISAEVES